MTSTGPTTSVEAVDAAPELVVLILVGLVASGKSAFAQALERHFPHFRRCNQDDLGDRRKVERLARQCLGEGLSVCIDRTNFDAKQRSHWINIAREFPGTSIWVLVLDIPYEVCRSRIQQRTSHPTIKTPEEGLWVLERVASDLRLPTPSEGYDRILSLKHSEHPGQEYSQEDVSSILRRIRMSPPVSDSPTVTPSPTVHSHGFRGRFPTGGIGRRGIMRGGWRPAPKHMNVNNWRERRGSSHVSGTASEFIDSAQGQGTSTETS